MPFNYDQAELVATLETIRTPPRFFLDRFFRRPPVLSEARYLVFDEVMQGLPVMAPFVSPVVQAKPQRREGASMKAFSPAYLKPKHAIRPGDFFSRAPGEPFKAARTPEERHAAAVVDLLATQKGQIEARWEWMAAQAVINGKVTVAGEDYPSVEVDFGRAPSHNVILATNLWSTASTDIGAQLEAWSAQLLADSGFAGTDVIFSPEAWAAWLKNDGVKAQAALLRGVQSLPSLQPATARPEGVTPKGQWGEFNLFVYTGSFRDQDGTTTRALGAGEILMTAAPSEADGTGGVEGVKAFGAIEDFEAPGGLAAADMWAKTWVEKDPSVEQLMTQSAPLMIPGRPNATLKAKVL
jgi:hypothetical protein